MRFLKALSFSTKARVKKNVPSACRDVRRPSALEIGGGMIFSLTALATFIDDVHKWEKKTRCGKVFANKAWRWSAGAETEA